MPQSSTSSRKAKFLNLFTVKFHFLGDYVHHIRLFGTTDSYSTQLVSKRSKFAVIGSYWLRHDISWLHRVSLHIVSSSTCMASQIKRMPWPRLGRSILGRKCSKMVKAKKSRKHLQMRGYRITTIFRHPGMRPSLYLTSFCQVQLTQPRRCATVFLFCWCILHWFELAHIEFYFQAPGPSPRSHPQSRVWRRHPWFIHKWWPKLNSDSK
jgi:hypothetical protein